MLYYIHHKNIPSCEGVASATHAWSEIYLELSQQLAFVYLLDHMIWPVCAIVNDMGAQQSFKI
jgi:hypothetical protein